MSSPVLRTDRAEHHRPGEHLGVADLVELRAGHVQQRVGVAGFELREQPAIEVELRRQVFSSCPGKCDMPPLAIIATRSFRPLMMSAIALPSAAQRLGVGSGGT